MKRIKQWLAVLLSALLLATLLPTGVFAADTEWASTAVNTLNSIYGRDVFAASDDEMTVDGVNNLIRTTGWAATEVTDTGSITRAKACEVLAEAFKLPVDTSGGQSAIQYLYEQNIINGQSETNLAENDPVTMAEFAVLTYRVVNATGGGKGSSNTELKPGTEEYFAWMYLAARACVPFNSNQLNKKMSEVSFTFNGNNVTDGGDNAILGESLWTQWKQKLNISDGSSELTYSTFQEKTALEAAKALVSSIDATQIFTDVSHEDWYYDGVMYLFDLGVVSGIGEGGFEPDTKLSRVQLAVLLARVSAAVDGTPVTPGQGEDAFQCYMNYATSNGYINNPPEDTANTWWGLTDGGSINNDFGDESCATRGEIIVAFLKQRGVGVTDVNTAILDRFNDTASISENDAHYIAYAVSHGLVQGSANGGLGLAEKATRAEVGVLLYRTLIGVDQTKMQDYGDSVGYLLRPESGSTQQTTEQGAQSAFAITTAPTFADSQEVTLTLREDWRLTDDLDLDVPDGTTLTIQGNGQYYIYEMGGKLQNSGLGKVEFAENTILYTAGSGSETSSTTNESNQLMMERQPHKVEVASDIKNGTVAVTGGTTQAKMGTTVKVTVTANEGFVLESITYTPTEGDNRPVTVTGSTFEMPASDVTITATFKEKTSAGGNQGTGTGSGSGTGGGSTPTHTVKVEAGETSGEEGSVEISTSNAAEGDTVTLTASPEPGYRLGGITVLNSQGGSVDLTKNGENEYEFTMPSGSVTVKAEFEMIPPPFEDTAAQAWYYEAVHYAYYHGIMSGTGDGEFSPNATLSRAMVAQILYNLEGQPTMTGESTFVDAAEHWAADAIAWAKQTGVVAGYEGNVFRPERAVTREELAQMLYNYAQYKGYNLTATGDLTVFPDGDMVQDWAETAMSWANGNKLINGSEQAGGNLILSPNGNTTRAEAASILMNFDLNLVEEE